MYVQNLKLYTMLIRESHAFEVRSETKFEARGPRNFFQAAAMLVREHKFRTPRIELTRRGTSSSGQKNISRSLGTQYGRRVIKAYHNRRKQRHEPIRIPGNYL